jgi:hypothetical protein
MSIVKLISYGLLTLVIGFVFASACNWFGDGANTLQKEYAPSALLKKYEDFKRLSAAIDKKRADINLYREELSSYYDANGKLIQNDKETRQYLEQRKSELIGIISIHNQLVADYNTRMVEFNYKFTNKGDLPYTNADPLPREHKLYILTLKTKQNEKED